MQIFRWLIDYPFLRDALIAGVAVGSVCSLLSVVVVLKRMAFIGEGVSHAGFGGIGTAVFLGMGAAGQNLMVLAFCVAVALAIGVLSRRRHIEPDSAIGILLVAAVAWGVVMSDLIATPWYARTFGIHRVPFNWEQFLFGSIINLSHSEMWIAVIVSVAVLVVCVAFFKEIVFFAFDEPVSRVFGVNAGFIYYLLLVLLSVMIVLTVRLAGILLVSALLVIPGATALQVSRRLGLVLLLAWIVGVVGMVGGLLLSLQVGDISTGPCIVGVLCTAFGLVFTVQSVRRAVG